MKERILVVDDDWAMLELLKFKLTKRGFEVLVAKNEKECFEQAFQKEPKLLILDIWLGKALGTNIYQNLLNFGLDREIPVIFITALVQWKQPRHSPIGAKYVLLGKPFDFGLLFGEVDKLLGNFHTRRITAAAKPALDARVPALYN